MLHLGVPLTGRAIRYNLFVLRHKKDFRYYPSRECECKYYINNNKVIG
jgi:hypothetical protein